MADLHVSVDRGLAQVVLNRPDKRNALNLEILQGLVDAQETLKAQEGLRAVLLRGEGPAFCAGLDIRSFEGRLDAINQLLNTGKDGATLVQRAALGWRSIKVPVIAVLQGSVLGGGLQIALGADLRFAAEDAALSLMEVRWGLVPDMGASITLPALVRQDVAMDMAFTGRVVKAPEAKALGLVTRIDADPLAVANQYLQELVGRSPEAIAAAKALFARAWDAQALKDKLSFEAALQISLLGSPNQVEAAKANFEGRPPLFR